MLAYDSLNLESLQGLQAYSLRSVAVSVVYDCVTLVLDICKDTKLSSEYTFFKHFRTDAQASVEVSFRRMRPQKMLE